MKAGQIWKAKGKKDKFMVLSVGENIAMVYPLQAMKHDGMRSLADTHNGEIPLVMADAPRFLEFFSDGELDGK